MWLTHTYASSSHLCTARRVTSVRLLCDRKGQSTVQSSTYRCGQSLLPLSPLVFQSCWIGLSVSRYRGQPPECPLDSTSWLGTYPELCMLRPSSRGQLSVFRFTCHAFVDQARRPARAYCSELNSGSLQPLGLPIQISLTYTSCKGRNAGPLPPPWRSPRCFKTPHRRPKMCDDHRQGCLTRPCPVVPPWQGHILSQILPDGAIYTFPRSAHCLLHKYYLPPTYLVNMCITICMILMFIITWD